MMQFYIDHKVVVVIEMLIFYQNMILLLNVI